MSETQHVPGTGTTPSPADTPSTVDNPGTDRAEPTGWIGWVVFGGVMMILVGGFQATMGLVALFNDQYFLVTSRGLLVGVDYTTWGWIHLVLGTIAGIVGVGVMVGETWARVIGIILAAVSALVNVAFLAAYPVWSTIVITLDIIVIYAIAVHGREVRDSYQDA
jgi:hypothetical protein